MRLRILVAVLLLAVGSPRPGVADEGDPGHAEPGAERDDDHADGASGAHAHGDDEDDDHADERPRVAHLERFGVRPVTAGPGLVDVEIALPGEVRANADRIAHIAPRFAGVVRSVQKRVGDPVRAGETLAIIESDTLAPYTVTAAFDGVVIDRHITPGEMVQPSEPAFIVANLSTVWVDVDVYQRALDRIAVGQAVRISASQGALTAEGTISYVSPMVDQTTRTGTARMVLDNPDGLWRPGLFVDARVARPVAANVVVPRRALQRVDDRTVVFVDEDGAYVPRPVVTGMVGRTTVEITAGLAPGERFADEGSFLVKADSAKGSAEHAH